MSREGTWIKLEGKRLLLYKKSQARGQIPEAVEKIHRCPDKGVPCGQELEGTASLVKQDSGHTVFPAPGLFACQLDSGVTHRWKDVSIYFH